MTGTDHRCRWPTRILVDAVELVMDFRGRTPKKLGLEWGEGDISAISARNVRMGSIDFNIENYRASETLYNRWMTRGDMARGDVLFTTEAPLGNVAQVPDDRRYVLSQRTILLRAKRGDFDNTFLLYVLQSPEFQRLLTDNASGSTALGIQRKRLERLEIASPSLDAQQTIAGALNDADLQIRGLERLIAKRRDVKQGIMQKLLTGQSRLAGFTGDWREIPLGDHVTYLRTVALSRDQLDQDSPLRYLHYGDIHTRTSVRLDAAVEGMPRAESHLAAHAGRLMRGDLVFADASEDPEGVGKSVEISAVPQEGVVPGLHTIAARFDKSVLADGFKAYIQFVPTFRAALLRLAAGTKVLATTRSYISSITLTLPEVDEQSAIAEVLSDADTEIAALERRLESARAVKVGMMQELLTGRTRLPLEEEA